MIDLSKYVKNLDDLKFLQELIEQINCQSDVALTCGDYSFLVEPYGESVEIWHDGEKIVRYESLFDMFFNFNINGKPFIDCVSLINFAD